VIVADEAHLDLYLSSPEDFAQARTFWSEHFKPWKMRSRVKELARELGFDSLWQDPEAFWRARWDLYGWLSKSVHVDFAALVVESVAADQDGRYNPNLGGRSGRQSAATLRHLGVHAHDFLALLALFLARRHDWAEEGSPLKEPLGVVRRVLEHRLAPLADNQSQPPPATGRG